MALVGLVLVSAAVLGRLTGGRVAGLAALPLRAVWLAGAALAVQVGGALLAAATGSRPGYLAAVAASAALAGAFLARNRAVPGVPLIALGLVANTVVVAANGAMPVSRAAAARAGVALRAVAPGGDPRHVLAGAGTVLRPLGDVIPVPLPPWPAVSSPGDLLVAAGVGLLVFSAMRRAPRPPAGDRGDRGDRRDRRGRRWLRRRRSPARHRAGRPARAAGSVEATG